jgi:hypothetical protein
LSPPRSAGVDPPAAGELDGSVAPPTAIGVAATEPLAAGEPPAGGVTDAPAVGVARLVPLGAAVTTGEGRGVPVGLGVGVGAGVGFGVAVGAAETVIGAGMASVEVPGVVAMNETDHRPGVAMLRDADQVPSPPPDGGLSAMSSTLAPAVRCARTVVFATLPATVTRKMKTVCVVPLVGLTWPFDSVTAAWVGPTAARTRRHAAGRANTSRSRRATTPLQPCGDAWQAMVLFACPCVAALVEGRSVGGERRAHNSPDGERNQPFR